MHMPVGPLGERSAGVGTIPCCRQHCCDIDIDIDMTLTLTLILSSILTLILMLMLILILMLILTRRDAGGTAEVAAGSANN